MAANEMNNKPLDGINVLDFCWVAVGPMTTKYLGEYGATVVRVESAKRPGTLRRAAPFKDGISGLNRSAYFASYNANKMGITVDMRHPIAASSLGRLFRTQAIQMRNVVCLEGAIDRVGKLLVGLGFVQRFVVCGHNLLPALVREIDVFDVCLSFDPLTNRSEDSFFPAGSEGTVTTGRRRQDNEQKV